MKTTPTEKIRVLIVDDSLVSQKFYRHLLEQDERFSVLGVVSDGREAVEFVRHQKPDVINMDIHMPLMDGIEATRLIMQTHPVPIVVCSSLYDSTQQEMSMHALDAGAVAILPKPFGPGHPQHEKSTQYWLKMIRSMSEVKVIRRLPHLTAKVRAENQPSTHVAHDFKLLLIGASAGGPEGVKTVLSKLGTGFYLPVVIVQHIDANFTESYRMWLQSYTSLPVVIAGVDEALVPGKAYLAPGDYHLIVKQQGKLTLSSDLPVNGHRPSVARLFESAAKVYGENVIAILLSGMGKDGAAELKILKDKGALTYAQSEESCLVFGMPGEAVRIGAAVKVADPEAIINDVLKIKSSY